MPFAAASGSSGRSTRRAARRAPRRAGRTRLCRRRIPAGWNGQVDRCLKLAAGGIEVTALHNHLLRNQPFTMYMHVQGNGDPVKLAAVLHAALAESKTPLSAAPT